MIILLLLTSCLNTKFKEKEKGPIVTVESISEPILVTDKVYNTSYYPPGHYGRIVSVASNLGSCCYWTQPTSPQIFNPDWNSNIYGLYRDYRCDYYNGTLIKKGNLDIPLPSIDNLSYSRNPCILELDDNYHFFYSPLSNRASYFFIIDSKGNIVYKSLDGVQDSIEFFRICSINENNKRVVFLNGGSLMEYDILVNGKFNITEGRKISLIGNGGIISANFLKETNDLVTYHNRPSSLFLYSDNNSTFNRILSVSLSEGQFETRMVSLEKENKIYFLQLIINGIENNFYELGVNLYRMQDGDFILNRNQYSKVDVPELSNRFPREHYIKYVEEFDLIIIGYDIAIENSQGEVREYRIRLCRVNKSNNNLEFLTEPIILDAGARASGSSGNVNNIDFVFMKDPENENKGKIRMYYPLNVNGTNIIKYTDVLLSFEDEEIRTTVVPTNLPATTTITSSDNSNDSSYSSSVVGPVVGAMFGGGIIGWCAHWLKNKLQSKKKVEVIPPQNEYDDAQVGAMYANPAFVAGEREYMEPAAGYRDLEPGHRVYAKPGNNDQYSDLTPDHRIYKNPNESES